MIEISLACLIILVLVNLVAILTTRGETNPIVWRRKNTCMTFGDDVSATSLEWLKPQIRAPHEPISFRKRLASYLHCEESRLRGPGSRSNMIFWASSTHFTGKPAKPRRYIGMLLNRIHRIVGG